MNDINMKLIKN